jgi:U3 small nucleolar RNA-associated protein 4
MTFASDRALVLALPVINRLEAFDVESRRLCREVLPGMHHFEKQSDSILGISYHASSNKILAWGQGWLGAVEVKQSAQPRRGETRTKRKRNQQIQQDNAAGEGFARVVQGYRQLTALAPIGKEILVVERPFTDLRNLPPAFTTAKYGT